MKVLITLVFIGAIVTLGIMVSKGNPSSSASPTTENSSSTDTTNSSVTESSPVAQGGGSPTGKLFVYNDTGASGEIYTVDVESKEKKVIFTDRSNDQRIKNVSNLTKHSDTVIVVLGSDIDPAGQLVAVAADGSGKKTVLADNFVSAGSPTVSPDQTKLALVSFSNAEPNVGFTLSVMDISGKNKKDLAIDSSGIGQLAFSPDGKQIAFIKGAAATASEIAVVTLATGKVETLHSIKGKIIEDFDWSPLGPLLITAIEGDKKNIKTSEVYLTDPKTKTDLSITKNGRLERSPQLAPDATGVAYVEYKDSNARSGDVIMALTDGKNTVTLGTGTQILGWAQ
jgi:Tol biopolymer transport system component